MKAIISIVVGGWCGRVMGGEGFVEDETDRKIEGDEEARTTASNGRPPCRARGKRLPGQ